ncbi:hypothetical protein HT031_004109 [Scenedesmus sp. PABB004]|nr:hypothetical protein HT031_004109 [Scenedesmus sp. PABB004]
MASLAALEALLPGPGGGSPRNQQLRRLKQRAAARGALLVALAALSLLAWQHVRAGGPAAPAPARPRTNHIFGGSMTDDCPQQLLPGSWMAADDAAAANTVGGVLPLTAEAALDSGRLLAEAPGHFLAADDWCAGRDTLDACYFEPLSHCRLSAEEVAGAVFSADPAALADPAGPRVMATDARAIAAALRDKAPTRFAGRLAATAIPAKNHYYWWRAQGVAYIVRPNARTREELSARERAKFRGAALAPGCVSLYVRHGDKGTEAPTFTDAQYEAAVLRLLADDPALSRQLFLSTEDPATVVYFASDAAGGGGGGGAGGGGGGGGGGNASAPRRGWAASYVDMPRKPDAAVPNLLYMTQHGMSNEVLDGLLNLDLALRCDGFVASIYSNWARLIDELRSTVRCRAHALYADASGPGPVSDFNW